MNDDDYANNKGQNCDDEVMMLVLVMIMLTCDDKDDKSCDLMIPIVILRVRFIYLVVPISHDDMIFDDQ